MLHFSRILGCFAAVSVASLVACAAPQDEAVSNTAAITGDSNEAACDVQRIWGLLGDGSAAAVSKDNFVAFTHVTPDPAATQFFAFGLGDGKGSVWIQTVGATSTFYKRTDATAPAALLMTASAAANGTAAYTDPSGQPIVCAANSNDDAATASCLNKDPIDATQYPYTKTHPAMPGSCTADDLATFSQYYRDHASDNDLVTGWKNSVPATCSSCIFSNDTNAAWAPMISGTANNGSASFSVNSGGCIEEVSNNEACGRAYNQFQQCTLEACLKDCQTQTEFTKCRQDATVLTTSCKDAYASLQNSCGAGLNTYQSKCKGTSYTFEGPIKVLCIGN